MSAKLAGEDVIITDDGFVGIMTENPSKAFDLVNAVFATALTWAVPAQLVHLIDNDLCRFIEIRTNRIHIDNWGGVSARNTSAIARDNDFALWTTFGRTPIPPDRMKEIIHRANDYLEKPKLLEDLLLLAGGWSLQFAQKARKAAFLYCWMVIETVLTQMWQDYVDSLGRHGQDKEDVENFRNWTTYHYIEVFSMTGKIAEPARLALTKLRRTRNAITHRRVDPTQKELSLCVNSAAKLVINRIQGKNPFDGIG